MPVTYDNIATTTLGSATNIITFSSIPATYTDLVLTLVTRGATSDIYPSIRFNSDSGSNYSNTLIRGEGNQPASARYSNITEMYLDPNYGATSTIPEFIKVDIFSYTGSTNKTALIDVSIDKNGSGGVLRSVGLWRNTAAINRIDLIPSINNFATGTTATLYGIKNA